MPGAFFKTVDFVKTTCGGYRTTILQHDHVSVRIFLTNKLYTVRHVFSPNVDQVGGKGAVSSTVANTKQSVVNLQRRSVSILSRSDPGGVTDFTQSQAGSRGLSASRLDRSRRVGQKQAAHGDDGSVDKNNNNNDVIIKTNFSNSGVPSAQKIPHRGGAALARGSHSMDASVVPALGDQTPHPTSDSDAGRVLVGSGVKCDTALDPVVSRAYGETSAGEDGKEERNDPYPTKESTGDVQGHERKTTAGRIGVFLTALPLSKLKIVIGKLCLRTEWSIYGSFKPDFFRTQFLSSCVPKMGGGL